ncbi:hypothetical protein GCM10010306_070100 [Streptomyces umbrinus]|nr:hypothetical protein GCM10010306_070100 [Streptomyces umbrinus]
MTLRLLITRVYTAWVCAGAALAPAPESATRLKPNAAARAMRPTDFFSVWIMFTATGSSSGCEKWVWIGAAEQE